MTGIKQLLGEIDQQMAPASSSLKLISDFSTLDQNTRTLLAYWQSKCRQELLPGRKDIDPIEIPRLMSDVVIVDVLRDPLDFRYRLVGTHVVAMIGSERTGKRMREVFTPEAISESEILIERLISTRAPVAFTQRFYWIGKEFLEFSTLILPLASDGTNVDMAIMGFHFPTDKHPAGNFS
ncbi:MAG: PAS domain-containing protein [Parvibaculum sp.]|nr:PAS domain-containing protein [Parvibaculum sp.]|tara:strand:+ start:10356 stop:10895 length:540 start_codon:yes stop_codon:yes gene_type:complete